MRLRSATSAVNVAWWIGGQSAKSGDHSRTLNSSLYV